MYKPDIVFYLTASPKDCIRECSNSTRIESGAFAGIESDFVKHQTKMKLIYDKLSVDKNWTTIVRNKDAITTCNDILKAYKNISVITNETEK